MKLFRRSSRTEEKVPPPEFSLPVLNGSGDLALTEKLRSEQRTCPTCGYHITNPMTDRCPRCFGAVPLSEHTNCGSCSHQGNCEFHHLANGKG